MKRLRAIDLCSGAGGWAVAARGLPIEVVLAVDFWPTACRTYELNHPATRVVCGDLRSEAIHTIVMEAARGVDLVVGGIPCEWLSSYRVLQPVGHVELAAQRHTLDSVLATVRDLSPRYWCLEDFKAISKELPLFTPWQEINARHYSPQRRKRIFVGEFPPPARGNDERVLEDGLLPGPYRIGKRAFGRVPQRSRTFSREHALGAFPGSKAPTVTAQGSRGDSELVVVDDRVPGGIRNFEWQELARMQGVPTDYLFYGSPTDVMKMVGRAVQIDTAREILKSIVADFVGEKTASGLPGADVKGAQSCTR